jgi:hypothetical protein
MWMREHYIRYVFSDRFSCEKHGCHGFDPQLNVQLMRAVSPVSVGLYLFKPTTNPKSGFGAFWHVWVWKLPPFGFHVKL